jgi:RNase P subunit RPR2
MNDRDPEDRRMVTCEKCNTVLCDELETSIKISTLAYSEKEEIFIMHCLLKCRVCGAKLYRTLSLLEPIYEDRD